MSDEQKMKIKRLSGEVEEMTVADFAESFEDFDDVESAEPSSFTVHCSRCNEESEADWSKLQSVLANPCSICEQNDQEHGEMAIGASYEKAIAGYGLFKDRLQKQLAARSGRPDYWDYVIHFAKYEAIVGILTDRQIRSAPTGLFRVSAVCLTDTPLAYSETIRSDYGEYGLAFKKSDILKAGGGPAVYLNDIVIEAQRNHFKKGEGFSEALKPFVNVYRHPSTAPKTVKAKYVDYLHDREWRVPGDLDLDETSPCGMIFPKGRPIEENLGPQWSELLRAAYEYGSVKQD